MIGKAADRMVVGTRGSRLAVLQTTLMVNLLRDRFPLTEWSIVTLRTRGDDLSDRPLAQIGDKGVFVHAIERALVAGEIDVAVHSLKDVPVDLEVPELEIAAFSRRGDARDAFVGAGGVALHALPAGARVGTSSLRRRVQLAQVRSDLECVDIRGNVDTRLEKLSAGEYDALVLAAAGLQRLNLERHVTAYLPAEDFTPDAGQGILALQTRRDSPSAEMVRSVDDVDSHFAACAERAVVRGLGANCHSPVGAYAVVRHGRVSLSAMAASEDGRNVERLSAEAPVNESETIGLSVGRRLLSRLNGSQHAGILDHA